MCFHARLSRVDVCWCYLCRLAGFTHAEVLMSCHATSVLWRARHHALSEAQDNVHFDYGQQFIPWKIWGEMVNFTFSNFLPTWFLQELTSYHCGHLALTVKSLELEKRVVDLRWGREGNLETTRRASPSHSLFKSRPHCRKRKGIMRFLTTEL